MYKKLACVIIMAAFAINVFLSPYAAGAARHISAAVPDADESASDTAEATVYERLEIKSAEDFLQFAENCRLDSYSANLEAVLMCDIDLSDSVFQGIPIFCGVFDGNGHSITGLSMAVTGSNIGFFRFLEEGAVVRNLTVSGEIAPQGSKAFVGGIAGSNAGKIENCTFSGSVTGAEYIGGIAGRNLVTGVIENCTTSDSEIHGDHFVGGIAGENMGVIRDCRNSARINTTARQNSVELSDITIETLTNSEAFNTVTDIGGIAGSSAGVIIGCKNSGDVGYRHMGYNIGGIAGSQMGYIAECENSGSISGRKEVGGIAGQMEPAVVIEYTEDTLQILEGQLGTLGQLADQAAANAQSGASDISGQLMILQGQIEDANEALDILLPDTDTDDNENDDGEILPEVPDLDTILAAQNTLSSSLEGMRDSISGIVSSLHNVSHTLSSDMQAVSEQIDAMGATVSSSAESMGASVLDISDNDTESDISGKVAGCVNYGAVLADLGAGGIAGAIALENDLDIEEDYSVSGESSMNFSGQLRAVILDCENRGEVTVKKQYGGGIVGFMQFGLVKDCISAGRLSCDAADYVGGVAGSSRGYIRQSHAKCEIAGHTYVGGIAGTASVLTDCRSMVVLTGTERFGAVLGYCERIDAEQKNGNFYLSPEGDIGAIDGISYDGVARSLSRQEFMKLEGLPDIFRRLTVQFIFDDGTIKSVEIAPGGSLNFGDVPAIPAREGYTAEWGGLQMQVQFDTVYNIVYTLISSTIQSEQTSANGLPVMLYEGNLGSSAAIVVGEGAPEYLPEENQTVLQSASFEIYDSNGEGTVRYLLGGEYDTDRLVVMLHSRDGEWSEAEARVDGSYVVFAVGEQHDSVVLLEEYTIPWLWIASGASGVVLIAVIAIAAVIRKKRGTSEE